MLSFQGLGETTLSKIAEVALSNQLKADKLKVTVKTNPEKLAKGIVESLAIDTQGLVMSNNQRLENLKMTFAEITVNPLQALVGKIKLTKPSQGTADFVLSKQDIEQRLNRIKPKNIKSISCSFTPNGDLTLQIVLQVPQQQSQVQLRPQLCPIKHRVFLEPVYDSREETVPAIILQETEALLNLRYFHLQGLSLKIHSLGVHNGRFTLKALTEISDFPQVV